MSIFLRIFAICLICTTFSSCRSDDATHRSSYVISKAHETSTEFTQDVEEEEQ